MMARMPRIWLFPDTGEWEKAHLGRARWDMVTVDGWIVDTDRFWVTPISTLVQAATMIQVICSAYCSMLTPTVA